MKHKCSLCERHQWGDPQDAVLEESGERYCLFHAPWDKKYDENGNPVGREAFTEMVFARIGKCAASTELQTNKVCNMSGVVFPWDMSMHMFNADRPVPAINFASAEFCGGFDCSAGYSIIGGHAVHGVHFSGDTCFFGAKFHGEADFRYAKFAGDVEFYGAKFYDNARFQNVTFSGRAHYYCAKFYGYVNFNHAHFYSDAVFDNSTFEKRVEFNQAEFCGIGSFMGATFNNIALFAYAKFKFEMNVEHCTLGDDGMAFTRLDKISLSNIVFSRYAAAGIEFVECEDWPERLGLDLLRKPEEKNLRAAILLYRAMKQRAASEHDQKRVSHWHFREKLMALKLMMPCKECSEAIERFEDTNVSLIVRMQAWLALLWYCPFWKKFTLTGLYWACSGFGERAVRAGVVLLALLALPFLANSPIGHFLYEFWSWMPWADGVSSLVQGVGDSISASAAMEFIPFTKDIKGEGWAKVGQGLWQALVMLQFTLFALAVRNRFRR